MSNKNNTSVTFDEWLKHQKKKGNIQNPVHTGPKLNINKIKPEVHTGPKLDINKIKPEVYTGPTVKSKKKKGKR